MKNTFKVIGTLSEVTHYSTSLYGDKRYSCDVTDINGQVTKFYTGVNSPLGYNITGYYGDMVSIVLVEERGKTCLDSIKKVHRSKYLTLFGIE